MKSFGVSFETALYDMSYANVLLYTRTLPDYSVKKHAKDGANEKVNADDPANKAKVEKILFGNG